MIEIGAVSSETTNLTTRNINALASRNVSGGDDVQTVDMSFDDFLDMINPLQHIPGVSTIYRAIAGEEINPVSRIAGDALYGGVFGLASAGVSALCAIGDEAVGAVTGGQSASASIMTALLGDGKSETTQVAAASKPENTQATGTATDTVRVADASASATTPSAAPGMPLDRTKLPYGGVMDSTMMANSQQNQALALAMTSQHTALQAQRNVHNSRLAAASAASAPADPVPAAAPTTTVATSAEPETQEAMQKLLSELQAMKAIKQYKSAAEAAPEQSHLNTLN